MAERSHHEVCRASAGSGKTYQLTSRYLRLIYHNVEPRTILATTFTRKAAGEILARVLGRLAKSVTHDRERTDLSQAIEATLTEADCLAMLRRVAGSLHHLSIGTLDSFFNRIGQCFALELDLPTDPLLLDDRSAAAEQLRLEAIEAMLGDADLPVFLELLRRLHHSTTRSITGTIDRTIADFHQAYRDAPDRSLWTQLHVPPRLDDDALRRAIDTLTAGAWTFTHKSTIKSYAKLLQLIHARDWESVVGEKLATADPGATHYGKPLPPDYLAAMQPILDHAIAEIHQRLAHRTEAYFDVLHRFDEHYTQLRREQRVMLFHDVTHRLAHVLPTLAEDVLLDVYYRLDGRVQHLMLDEFQDTSRDQWAVLEPIAQEITGDATGDGSFYCVGDTKQAIYGWRGGCAELFTHIENALAGGTIPVSTLAESYRSSQVILDAVNSVFANLSGNPALAEHADVAQAWDAQYETHVAARKLPGYVRLETTPTEVDDEEDDEAGEPSPRERFIAGRIAEIYHADPNREIGVLVQRNRLVPRLLYELRRAGVDASGEGGHTIADAPAVAAVLSALTMADHPGDGVASFHAANSPVAAVLGMRSTHDAPAAALRIRRDLIDRGYPAVLADWMRQLAPSCDATNLRRLEQLVELAEQFEPIATLRAGDFVSFVRSSRSTEATGARVRIMTVHAAKGLGFDAVVLADLDRGMRLRSELLIDRDHATSPVRGVYANPNKAELAVVPQLQPIAQQSERVMLNEQLCVLYVAMTRAKQGLYLFTESKKPRRLSHARMVMHGLAGVDEPPDTSAVLFESGDPAWMTHDRAPAPVVTKTSPIRLNLPGKARSWTSVSPSSLEQGGRVSTSDLLRIEPHGGRAYGSHMHELLAQVTYLDEMDQTPDELRGVLSHPAIRSALERNGATDLWRERDFVVRDGDRLLTGTFDRVVFHDGGATIIDFKTDAAIDLERYRPQLAAYRRALALLRRLDESAIRCRLLFIGKGEVVDL